MAEGARITIDAQLQFRHDVEANWLAADPILKVGEPAYTIGYSDRFKLGDGQSKWSELPYLQLGEGGGGGGSQAYESLAWSAIKTLTSGDASVLAQAYAVKQAYNELKSLIPDLADYYTKEQVNALIPSLEGYATESWVLGKGYATESFVNTKIADLINGAPTTLDTLKEIADAFAASQDVIEALDEAIGKKANQSDLTALAARVAANEGNITSLSSNKLDKSIWDSVFEIDAKGNLRAKVGIYSTSFISARTSDPSAGGGSGGAFSLYTWDQVKAMTAEVGGVAPTAYALKQAYNELINATPTLSWNNIQDKPIFATVATSGSYSDLIGRPTALSDLSNDVGYITAAAIPSTYAWSAITSKPITLSGYGITDAVTAGTIEGVNSLTDWAQSSPSFVGSISTSGWWNVLSIRHRNGASDGNEYGMLLYTTLTYGDSLRYKQHCGGWWTEEKVLLDSSNYSSYALPLSGGTLTGRDCILTINSSTDNAWVYVSVNSVAKASLGYYNGLAFISNDVSFARIGVNDSGIPQYWSSWSASTAYTLIHSGNISSYNAGSATKLQTARTIWGQSFDGTGDITGALHLDNNVSIYLKNTSGSYIDALRLSAGDGFVIGYGASAAEHNTFLEGANIYLRYGTSHTTGLTLNSSGNIGIGTTEPAYKLDVNGGGRFGRILINRGYGSNVGADTIEMDAAGATLWMQYYHGGAIDMCHGGGAVIMGGDLSVKKTISASSFKVGFGWKDSARTSMTLINPNDSPTDLILGTGNIDTWSINVRASDEDRYLGFYTYEGVQKQILILRRSGGADIYGNLTASGTIYSPVGLYTPGYLSARSTAGSSDRNLKTNIAPIRNALAYILETNYVSFDWKDTGEHSVGIIAQEELNREWSCLVQKYSEHYSYQYTQHTALLGSALQEEDKKVEALKAEVVTLKNKVQKLERQLWQQ